MGVAVALPRDDDALRLAAPILVQLRSVHLGDLGTWSLERSTPVTGSHWLARQQRLWTSDSATWTTVTPLVLPFTRSQSPAAIVADSCVVAGYPRPTAVAVSLVSHVPGAGAARRFATRRRTGDPGRAVHATVRFAHPVRGPVVVGPGRFFGLGLMTPLAQGAGDG
jgi:CRISPR-associated protein Csb2